MRYMIQLSLSQAVNQLLSGSQVLRPSDAQEPLRSVCFLVENLRFHTQLLRALRRSCKRYLLDGLLLCASIANGKDLGTIRRDYSRSFPTVRMDRPPNFPGRARSVATPGVARKTSPSMPPCQCAWPRHRGPGLAPE